MTKTAPPKTASCRRCHATLRATKSVALGIGARCLREERRDAAARQARREAALAIAVVTVDVSAFEDPKTVLDKAEQLILDGGLIPTRHAGQYLATGSDGVSTYLTDSIERSCTCKGHQRHGRCNHLLAADILALAAEILADPAFSDLALAA